MIAGREMVSILVSITLLVSCKLENLTNFQNKALNMNYGFSPSLRVAACQMERVAIVEVEEVIYSNFYTEAL